jgi:hypothetical protein
MKFSIGDQVTEKEGIHPYTSYNVLKVISILDGALLAEHYGWSSEGKIYPEDYTSEIGSRGWREGLRRYQEEELFTLEEAEAEKYNLEVAQDKLSQEFYAVRVQLKKKLDQAAALVEEAGAIAQAHNKTFFNLKVECMPLYLALNGGGWSHSHMQC